MLLGCQASQGDVPVPNFEIMHSHGLKDSRRRYITRNNGREVLKAGQWRRLHISSQLHDAVNSEIQLINEAFTLFNKV